jgi:hypothetical protein
MIPQYTRMKRLTAKVATSTIRNASLVSWMTLVGIWGNYLLIRYVTAGHILHDLNGHIELLCLTFIKNWSCVILDCKRQQETYRRNGRTQNITKGKSLVRSSAVQDTIDRRASAGDGSNGFSSGCVN